MNLRNRLVQQVVALGEMHKEALDEVGNRLRASISGDKREINLQI